MASCVGLASSASMLLKVIWSAHAAPVRGRTQGGKPWTQGMGMVKESSMRALQPTRLLSAARLGQRRYSGGAARLPVGGGAFERPKKGWIPRVKSSTIDSFRPDRTRTWTSVVLHLLDGMGQIQGATTSATTYELSKTFHNIHVWHPPYIPHGEGDQQAANSSSGSIARWLDGGINGSIDVARWLDANGGCLQPRCLDARLDAGRS